MTVEECTLLRRAIKPIAEDVRALVPETWVGPDTWTGNAEANANVILAYRHLEDASMRLGKAIQAIDGGKSVYDQTQVPKSAA